MGYKIKEIREAKGMSQQQLAERSGVARSIINGRETGRTQTTTTKTIQKIARALDKKVDEIFFDEIA